jgi:predicted secreted hydrolase
MSVSRAIASIVYAFWLCLNVTVAIGQGFSGLGAEADEYAKVIPGVSLNFPADHGAHSDYRIEWWYVTANLKDEAGVSYGVQWTLFRQAMAPSDRGEGWQNRQLWMGHAAVTSRDRHHSAERFARGGVGQAGVRSSPFAAWIDNWRMAAPDAGASESLSALTLTASARDFSYRLDLKGNRPVVLQGDAGYSRKSERDQASYYYSQPHLEVTGSIQIDGQKINVTGRAWIDHEWSSQPLAADQTGWDWFSIHLNSGEKLMLFRLRHSDGTSFLAGNWIDLDGRSIPFANTDIMMTPSRTSLVEGREVPTHWTISIPSRGLKLASVPLNSKSWMKTRIQYWEGPIAVTGTRSGVGYLEMTGY